ncbi:MAG TPA: ABC transporter permease [Pirellulales bacterium]|nr:ABC transporter permease [Pirellulales bacterium]
MSRLQSPPPADSVPPAAQAGGPPGSAWRGTALRLAAVAAAYLAAVGILCLAAWLGDWLKIPWLGLVGLAADVALLVAAGARLNRRGHALGSTIGPVVALLVIILLFAVADQLMNGERASFWSMRSLRTSSVQTSTIAVAALGMTLIIIAGGIDLSVGTTLSLAATVMAWTLTKHTSANPNVGTAVAIAACVATGCLAGLLNGLLTSLLRVVPFIITLGTMTAYLGIGKVLSKETTVRPSTRDIADWLPSLVTTRPQPLWLWEPLLPNFGWSVWLTLALAACLSALLHWTVFGRHVFAIGSNARAAQLCGIGVGRTRVLVYALAGLFTGVAGIYHFSRLSEGSPPSGLGMELKIIAAVVIGGGSLSGGRGSVVGTLAGAAIMQTINAGSTALSLPNPIQDIIIGVIIVAAVTLDQVRARRLERG